MRRKRLTMTDPGVASAELTSAKRKPMAVILRGPRGGCKRLDERVVSQFGGADILVCSIYRADRNVCPTKMRHYRRADSSRDVLGRLAKQGKPAEAARFPAAKIALPRKKSISYNPRLLRINLP